MLLCHNKVFRFCFIGETDTAGSSGRGDKGCPVAALHTDTLLASDGTELVAVERDLHFGEGFGASDS